MPARAYWKGYFRLSLVSFPIRLYAAATSTNRLELHQIHRPTGERVHYQKVVPDLGPVESEEIVPGYEYERGRWILLEPEEVEGLRAESRHTLEIVQFVDAAEIDPVFYDRPYFLAPDGEFAADAFRVVREALSQSGKVALGQVVFGSTEHVVALRPHGRGMLLETLRYADQVRMAEPYFEEIPEGEVEPEQLELARRIIESRTAPFEPRRFKNRYQQALKELVAAKLVGGKPALPAEKPRARVVNLMDALRRSVAELSGEQQERGKSPEPGERDLASGNLDDEDAGPGRRKRA